MERSSGIIAPIFSLPSPYGIGSLGKAAQDFVDFLAAAGQTWWQILPVGPTSYGDSPYQSPSTFAGNPYFIDLDLLVEAGLLTKAELKINWGDDASCVDYGRLFELRLGVLEKAFARGRTSCAERLAAFKAEHASWLVDYALFMALKERFDMVSWLDWPDEALRRRDPSTLEAARSELSERIEFYCFVQMLFFEQWDRLRAYAHSKGIGLIGDLPIYVALDSVDVWSEPQWFQLDDELVPVAVSGCPPDSFTATGQLWGNPLYNYDAMAQDGYGWWIRRIGGAARLFDVIRIDHFRGFESYWSVPFGDKTAAGGHWVKGPGMQLVGPVTGWFANTQFIAEDLGYLTDEVKALLSDSGLPGMKVLEFAFDSNEPSDYRPHTYNPHCVCYTGTHDNAPIAAWINSAKKRDLAMAAEYLGVSSLVTGDKARTDEAQTALVEAFLRAGQASVANLFVAQIQDWLALGGESRINTPGTIGTNWRWRLQRGQLTRTLAQRINKMTQMYGRGARHQWQS